jgi:hypothetical protein
MKANQFGSTVLLVAMSFSARGLLADSGWLDLSTAVVVKPRGASANAPVAVRVLTEEIERRTGIRLPVESGWHGDRRAKIVVALASGLGEFPLSVRSLADGFPGDTPEAVLVASQADGPVVVLAGSDRRGTLYAVGRFLRKLRWERGQLHFPAGYRLQTVPSQRIRGHQLGYRPKTNTYDAWTPEQFERYIRELALFGANAIEILPPRTDDAATSPHMKLEPLEMMIRLSSIIKSYGMEVWIWYPNVGEDYESDSAIREELREREEVFRSLPHIDHLFVPGGDPGRLHPDVLFPWLEKVAALLRKYHPGADIWVSPQAFRPTEDWVEAFFRHANAGYEWFGGVVFGPWVNTPLRELRKRLVPQVPIRRYPDITHTLSCQYPVWRWDLAYAITLGREPINPRPVAEKHIENLFHDLAIGTIGYSEGINDDVNKFVWLDQMWDPSTPVIETLRDYAGFFIEPRLADPIAQGILALERNWEGPLIANSGVEVALAQWRQLEEEAPPHVASNYRFQMCLLRAYYDAYIRRRLLYETELERRAHEALAGAQETGSLRALDEAEAILLKARREPVAQKLKERCWQLGDSLFKNIGAQLSVERYGAISRSRGAFLDGIDEPLNDARWLLSQFERIRKLQTEAERTKALWDLVNRTNPGPGGFYDNLGSWESWSRIVPGAGWESDPGVLLTPSVSFGVGLRAGEWLPTLQVEGFEGEAVPLAWLVQATTLYSTPLSVRYTGLDPEVRYRLRVAYTGRFQSRIRLVADSLFVIHEFIQTGEKPLWEFEIPPEATSDGELVLTWTCPDGERGSQVAELWLMREDSLR